MTSAGLLARRRARFEAEPLERAGTKAVHDHVCLLEQLVETRGALGGVERERRASLASRRLGDEGGDFLEAGRIDPQHVRAVRREEARAHRTGDDARDVEHADPRERKRGGRERPRRTARDECAVVIEGDLGLPRHRGAVGMLPPLVARVHRRGAPAGLDNRRLELRCVPARYRGLDGAPVRGRPEDLQRRLAMRSIVRVKADPSVGGAVVAGDRIPRAGGRSQPSGSKSASLRNAAAAATVSTCAGRMASDVRACRSSAAASVATPTA